MGSTLVFDIETAPDVEALDATQRAHLASLPSFNRDGETWEQRSGLDPQTGRVIVIAWASLDDPKPCTVFDPGPYPIADTASPVMPGVAMPEKHMLGRFWQAVSGASRLVTFNGYRFDAPFLTRRSIHHGILPSKEIASKWYDRRVLVDVAQELSVFGHFRQLNLDFACREFGVPTPKHDMHGSDVAEAYRRGEIFRIARYCADDVRALAELFRQIAPMIYRTKV